VFKFAESPASECASINSTIIQLILRGYNFDLDESIMHRLVFERVEALTILSSIGSIQPVDLLKSSSFKHLNSILLSVLSLKAFFHNIGLHWTAHLNNGSVVMFSETGTLAFRTSYAYPDTDRCLFAPLPLHTKSLLPLLNSNLSVCTEPVAWLTQDFLKYNNAYIYDDAADLRVEIYVEEVIPYKVYFMCYNTTTAATRNLTLIEAKLSTCDRLLSNESIAEQGRGVYYTCEKLDYGLQFLFEFTENILVFVLVPLACILGLLQGEF
jgi:hypothetical protein